MCHNYVGGGKGSDVKGFRIYFGFLRSPGLLPLVLLIIKFNEIHFKRHSLMPRGIPQSINNKPYTNRRRSHINAQKNNCFVLLIANFFSALITFILHTQCWIHSVRASEIFPNYCICHQGQEQWYNFSDGAERILQKPAWPASAFSLLTAY